MQADGHADVAEEHNPSISEEERSLLQLTLASAQPGLQKALVKDKVATTVKLTLSKLCEGVVDHLVSESNYTLLELLHDQARMQHKVARYVAHVTAQDMREEGHRQPELQ